MKKIKKLKALAFFTNWTCFKCKSQIRVLSSLFVCLTTFTTIMANGYSNNIVVSGPFQTQVTGSVSDISGPLPGATIIEKGTTNGTQTDFDGNFTLEISDPNAVLVFSYIGYTSQEISLAGQTTIDVVLEENASQLDEVVILGYTTRKKGELTGSVSTINNKVIEQSSSKDVAKSLAGRASGLFISDRGGVPGAGNGAGANTDDDATTILIRGKSTLNNNSPLILIDGIPAASFSNLSPQDIESLTVLKDGAAAIYGSRAANGVILITTKRGKTGKPKINFQTAYNISSFTQLPNLVSSEQYAIYENEIAERSGTTLPFTQEQINNFAAGNDPINFPNTDWADLTFSNSAPESRHTLSVSGGTENVKYFVSGDFLSQEGVYRSGALQFQQTQVRSNLDIKVTDDIKLGVDLLGAFGDRDRPGTSEVEIYRAIFSNLPTEVGIFPNGLPGFGGENGNNPIVMSSNESGFVENTTTNLRGKFSLDIRLDKILDGLSFNGYVGVRKLAGDTKDFYSPWTVYTFQEGTNEFIPSIGFTQRGTERILRETFNEFDETLINATLRYSKTFAEDHSISTFIGTERLDSNTRSFFAQRQGFPSDAVPELFAGGFDQQQSSGVSSEFSRFDFFGSASYDYKKKYFLDATIRLDGSSRFGPGRRYGTFPSFAASWAIDKESFLENVSWINSLRLRGSWSQLGNDRIAPNQFTTLFNFGVSVVNGNPNFNVPQPDFAVFGTNGQILNGFSSSTLANPDVTWETANLSNVGLTFSLFNNRLSGDVNYFFQRREDILVTRGAQIPDALGLQLPDENVGETKSYGYELELSWADKIGKVDYNLGLNFSNAKNEVVFLPEGENVQESLRLQGFPIDSNIIYPTNGIFNDQAEVNAAPTRLGDTFDGNGNLVIAAQEGDINYIDTNGDGVINELDRIRTRTSNIPQIQYGVYGGISYENFSLNVLFQGQARAETLVFFDQAGARPDFTFTERWTPNNRNAVFPRAFPQNDALNANLNDNSDVFQGADIWYQDASFVRLKEIELGYTLGKNVFKEGEIRIFARGFNLLTFFSDIKDLGLDPEVTAFNNFRRSTYSPLKTYTFGLNFSF